jgi:diacylglycerol O-acyltransferase
MRRIDLADSGFLFMEKRQTPMHVGGVNLFTLPKGVDEQKFLARQVQVLHAAEEFRKPFGDYVRTGLAGPVGPLYWEKDNKLDLDYHIRHSALPKPGRYRELFALVSRLHGILMDRNRPLWEVHLIEGLEDRQFALYMKMHHAAIDGVGAMHLTQAMCSTSKSARVNYSPLSLEAYERYKAAKYGDRPRRVTPNRRELRVVTEALKEQFDSTANILGALRQFGGAFLGKSGALSVPWHKVPRTSFNTQVTGARRFVAQSWDLARVKTVCKALDGTLNDVVLAMCAGALRRYLLSQNELPKEPLKAMAPVSLRAEGDLESANAVGFITANLATNIADAGKRMRAIQESMRAGKQLLQGMSAREAAIFMQLTQAPALLTSVLGLASRFPAFSTVVSNVPGPKKQLYWNGASLDGIYPASIVFDGFAMNITLVSYNGRLDFGIIACRRSVPHVQRVIDYLEEALVELEEVGGLRSVRQKRQSGRKRKTKTRAKSKSG